MDEGCTKNPNITPSKYPMKLWGLLAMVAPTAHITQQIFLIGSFPKIDFLMVKTITFSQHMKHPPAESRLVFDTLGNSILS